ncbi:hypothetical protein Ocin01_07624 [Orchesella cincta]|uniref:Uncharacterized protein n=1 Tax=Orchesella cincta TaxID=48709 RepID=A0A1D2N1H6_ORCCI|nr:hypothetical protein Ocin01_07624 [Orchesella cincta]
MSSKDTSGKGMGGGSSWGAGSGGGSGGCPWGSGGGGGSGQKCPKTGAVGPQSSCPGCKSTGSSQSSGGGSGKSAWGGK